MVGDLDDKITTLNESYQTTNQQLVQLQTGVDAENGKLDGLRKNYEIREAALKAHAEDVKRGEQNRAQIVSGLATAASIAATAVTANPVAASLAGGIVYAVGQSATGHSAFDSLSAGVQFAKAIKGPLTDASSALGSLSKSRNQYASFIQSGILSNITIAQYIDIPVENPAPGAPKTKRVTRDEALSELGEEANALSGSVQGLLDVYDKFAPQPSPVPATVEEDDSLKTIAGDIATTLAEIKLKVAALDTAQRQSIAEQTELTQTVEQLAKVRAVKVGNEEKRRSAILLATSEIRDEIGQFVSALNEARRLSLVEYGKPLPIDPALVQRTLVAETGPDWDPASAATSADAAADYVAMLQTRRQQIALLATRVEQVALSQFQTYVATRGTGPVITRPEQQFTQGVFSPKARKHFIQLVNQVAKNEFQALQSKNTPEFERLALERIEIPFDLSYRAGAPYPMRLIQAAITEASHTGQLAAGDVTFTVEVERVGNLRQFLQAFPDSDLGTGLPDLHGIGSKTMPGDANSSSCVSVDLRRNDSDPAQYYQSADFTIGAIDQKLTFIPTAAQSFWYLPGGDTPSTGRTMQVSFPPAEARMYLRVRLDRDAAWRNPPSFNSMTVKLEVFQ